MTQKTELRAHWKALRQTISLSRRKEAEKKLASYTKAHITPDHVLSFVSFGSEIDTQAINQWLAEHGALLLPRIENGALTIYQVSHPIHDLIPSEWGLLQPNPDRCKAIDPHSIQTILVPGLCFDESFHRLGYGKGHYDRLLCMLNCPHIGIGFQEQKVATLPHDPWDVPLDTVVYC